MKYEEIKQAIINRGEGNSEALEELASWVGEMLFSHADCNPVSPVEVKKAAGSWEWTHPNYFPFAYETCPSWLFDLWAQAQGIKTVTSYLESDEPVGEVNPEKWEPKKPDAESDWFMLSVHDTEDWGPVCIWACKKE